MSMKPIKSDVAVLKGKEAEDKVLEYMRQMNRPFGAVDVAANLKGAVPKSATQKMLASLAERGTLVMKAYGKTTLFVVNQANLECVSTEELALLEQEHKTVDTESQNYSAEAKTLAHELAKLKTMPTEEELHSQVISTDAAKEHVMHRLDSLRAGTPSISAGELAVIDYEWIKWRGEWVRRKKIFNTDVAASLILHAPLPRRFMCADLAQQVLAHCDRCTSSARRCGFG